MPDNKSLTVPPFESKLPAELLEGVGKFERHMYTKLDEIGQAQTWLIKQTVVQNGTLDEIRTQTVKTNGRVGVLEDKVKTLEGEQVSVKNAIDTVELVKKAVWSKWTWVAIAIFFVFVVPYIVAHAPAIQASMKAWMSVFAG